MKMSVEVARMRIVREIQDAEASLDTALIKQAVLLATLVGARRDTGAAPSEGHDALLRLVKAQQSLLTSGGDLARVHSRMLKIQEEKAGIHDCPPNEPMGTIQSDSFAA